jgi:uncharacterized membrane protein
MFGYGLDAIAIIATIGIINFIFWRWLLRRYIKDVHRRLIFVWFITIALTPMIYMAFIAVLIFSFTYIPSKDFDVKEWNADKIHRHQMADDIIDKRRLIGKDTFELKRLLGEPIYRSDTTWTFDMGAGGGGLGFLFHQLILNLDNGRVTIATHGKYAD